MDRATQALGEDDEDVANMKAGIAGLVFGNRSDDDIAEAAREMAQDIRAELDEAL